MHQEEDVVWNLTQIKYMNLHNNNWREKPEEVMQNTETQPTADGNDLYRIYLYLLANVLKRWSAQIEIKLI